MRRVLTVALLAASILLAPLVATVADAATLPTQHAQFVTRVLDLLNVERQRAGLTPLVLSGPLTRAAQTYAGVMADGTCFGHGCGSTLAERIDRVGYTNWTAAAENIALGHTTPEAVVAAWMASPGHRGNILSGTYRETGIGLAIRPSAGIVWVQDFGASRNAIASTPAANCTTRPKFTVHARPTGTGVLEVTVTSGTNAGAPSNTLRAVQFGTLRNGSIDIPGYGQAASNTNVGIAPGSLATTFVVRRTSRIATTVPLTLTDACGTWRTFVGAGTNVP